MRTRSLLVLCAATWAWLAAPQPAQQPSSWATLSVPGGAVPTSVSQLGKLVAYADAGTLHVFSAFTRRWHSHPFGAGAQLHQANDWVLIDSGTSYTAFASMRGTFETIAVSPAATVINPGSQRNDSIILVRDGSTLYSFSGFDGQWRQKSVSPSAAVAVQRHAAVVADGTEVFGMSAFDSTWVQQTVPSPVTSVFADGTVGLAQTSSTIWGFSAQQQTWSSAAPPGPGALPQLSGDVAVWTGQGTVLGFSGLLGEFRALALGGTAQLTLDQQLAVASSGNSTAFFSAPLGQWTVFVTFSPATLSTSAATALLAEPGAVHAYSALTGAVATLLVAPAQTDVNWTMAAVVEIGTGVPHLFSAFTTQWQSAATSPLGLFPLTAFNGALLQTATGFSAFSSRTGALVPLAEAQTANPHVDNRSGLLAVEGASQLHIFDPRRDVWLSTPRPGSAPLNVAIWRTSFMAREGQRCWGYGSQAGEIEVLDLPESEVNTQASSESVSVVTSNYVVAYSPVPDLVSLSQFPEFRRMFADGSTLHLQLRGEPGSPAAVLLGLPLRTGISLTSLGTFFLDPSSMGVLWAGWVAASGTSVLEFPMPAGLHGLRVAFQAGLLPPAGGAYVSRMSTLSIP